MPVTPRLPGLSRPNDPPGARWFNQLVTVLQAILERLNDAHDSTSGKGISQVVYFDENGRRWAHTVDSTGTPSYTLLDEA